MPDLPVAAPDHAETIRRFANDTDPTGEVVAALAALLAERQQDKELLGEVDVLLDCLAKCAAITGNTDWADQARSLAERIRAALAGEEDTTP